MKFYGKVFLSMMILISLSFSVFGTLMIQASFQSAFDREVEMGKTENQMLRITFETTINSIPQVYFENQNDILIEMARSVKQRTDSQKNTVMLINGDDTLIYSDHNQEIDKVLLKHISQEESGYRIYSEGEKYYLNVMSIINIAFIPNKIKLETVTDITHIYEERNQMFYTYRTIMLLMLGCVMVVALVISYFLTRSVRQLSGIARSFAKGNMDARALVKSNDEVGILARDFNDMAEKLSDRMLSLEGQAKRQEEFTSAFAHELKTPLTSIIGYADMIRSMNLSEEERIKAAGYIYSQGKRLESLSFKLMELLVMKKQEFEFVNLDAHYLIQTVFDLAEVGVLEKNLELKKKAEAGKVYGEKDLLISLFANLIDNSKKASESGKTIWIEGKNGKEGYEITVRDEGRGIPKEELGKITDAFYMVDKSRSRKEGGAGLGMTLCSEILYLHNAKWKIESEVGKGTSITVIFLQEEGK